MIYEDFDPWALPGWFIVGFTVGVGALAIWVSL